MIETRDLTKKYGDLYAPTGSRCGWSRRRVRFIGPNGAGKTTTMRISPPCSTRAGEASVCGYSIYTGSKDIRRSIGYMPDFFGVYDDMKVVEYLEFFAAAYRIKGPSGRGSEQVLELVDLGYSETPCDEPVPRMTQRLGLARVLLHEPQVLLLTSLPAASTPEPDRDAGAAQRTPQHEENDPGVQPHPAGTRGHLQQDRSSNGQVAFNGDVDTAIAQVRQKARFPAVRRRPQPGCGEDLNGYPEIESIDTLEEGKVIKVALRDGNDDGSFLPERLIQDGYKLRMFKEEEIDLEDVFMGITKGITN